MLFAAVASAEEIPNPLIDYGAFKSGVEQVGLIREKFRVSESEFIRMSGDPDTVILDARSAEKFALLHVKSAKNLSLPDITKEELAKVIPSKTTRVLIYCNNNFLNEPNAFPSKDLSASLTTRRVHACHTAVASRPVRVDANTRRDVTELRARWSTTRHQEPLEGAVRAAARHRKSPMVRATRSHATGLRWIILGMAGLATSKSHDVTARECHALPVPFADVRARYSERTSKCWPQVICVPCVE
jgi:hypothetical protein